MNDRARVLVIALLAASTAGCTVSESSPGSATEGDDSSSFPAQGIYGRAPVAAGGVPSVIMLTPANVGSSANEFDSTVTIDQFGLTFSPTLITIRLGTAVVFTNSESALAHNVRVRALGSAVDLIDADANPGERLPVTVSTAGGYDVLCDMHPGMTAFVFASNAERSVFAEADGTFQLDDVSPGTYTIQLWTAQGGFHQERIIDIGSGSTGIDLDTSG